MLRSRMSGERDERALHAGEEAKEEEFYVEWGVTPVVASLSLCLGSGIMDNGHSFK